MKVSVDDLISMFPRVSKNARQAVSGPIPMTVFETLEEELRPEMRQRMLRVWYRGPRPNRQHRKPTATLRKDATHAVLYPK